MWSCTAALIGPKTAITAANCLFNHGEEGGWRQNVVFWPAVNGEDNAPYGGFDYDTEYVFPAYIADCDGSYDGIWQYDVGLITFKDPIGDSLDWLGYTGEDMGDFQGTVGIMTTSLRSPFGSRRATRLPKASRRPTSSTTAIPRTEPTVRRSIIMTRPTRAAWRLASISDLPATLPGR